MGIRVYKPTSAARRFTSVLTFEELTKKAPEKSLLAPIKNHAGRNFSGKISVRHQGGGNRRKYRIQAQQGQHPRPRCCDRVRSEPLRVHRAARLCRW